MKNLLVLILAVVMISSCSKEQATVTEWEAVSLTVDATTVPIIFGLAVGPDFTTVGRDLNYTLTLDEEDMSWTVDGDYTLFTDFEIDIIPSMEQTFENKTKSGNYLETEDGLTFDNSLFDIEINELLWSKDDGTNLEFILSESGDKLIQNQLFENINVNQGLNANTVVQTEWRKK